MPADTNQEGDILGGWGLVYVALDEDRKLVRSRPLDGRRRARAGRGPIPSAAI
jgi:hypothetical protein